VALINGARRQEEHKRMAAGGQFEKETVTVASIEDVVSSIERLTRSANLIEESAS
jgi:hypothetical protein